MLLRNGKVMSQKKFNMTMNVNPDKLYDVLSKCNEHERDKQIKFEEVGHKYTILCDPKSKYTSVTTWNHSHFPKFDADAIIKSMMAGKNWKEGHKYWGMTPEQIKKQWSNNSSSVSSAGTDMHYLIECFMNNPAIVAKYTNKDILEYWSERAIKDSEGQSKEWSYFLKFVQDFNNLVPYRTEWLIYDEDLKLAGAIDMVFENPDGTLTIADWKRSKEITKVNNFNRFALTPVISHLPDSNFWHYALQLNTYRAILQKKYGKKVSHLCLVRLHPDNEEKTYELLEVPLMDKEIDELFELRKKYILK